MIPDSQFAELKRYLDREATRINDVRFIANDPVQFPTLKSLHSSRPLSPGETVQ